MDQKVVSIALVSIGALFMLASIIAGTKVKKSAPDSLHRRWTFISLLMAFFLVGYIHFIIIEARDIPFPLEMLTSVIFFWGAIFVFLVVTLTRDTVESLTKTKKQIEETRFRLLKKKQEVEKVRDDLLLERNKLEKLTKNIGSGLAEISSDYRVLWMNEVLVETFGDAVGKNCYDAFNKKESICEECGAKAVFDRGLKLAMHEQMGEDKNGKSVWSRIIATPHAIKDNKVTSVLEVIIPITEKKMEEQEKTLLIDELRKALSNIKTLKGLLPICASCKRIRDDKGYWNQLEMYIRDHSSADFTHGICPECTEKLYPEIYQKISEDQEAQSHLPENNTQTPADDSAHETPKGL